MESWIFVLMELCEMQEMEIGESHVVGYSILSLLVVSDVENELDQQLLYELFSEKFANEGDSRHWLLKNNYNNKIHR